MRKALKANVNLAFPPSEMGGSEGFSGELCCNRFALVTVEKTKGGSREAT